MQQNYDKKITGQMIILGLPSMKTEERKYCKQDANFAKVL